MPVVTAPIAPTVAENPTSAPFALRRFRHHGSAIALAAGSLLVAVGLALHISGAPEDESLARVIAEHPSRWLASHLLSAFGLVLLTIGMAAVVGMARGQGAKLAKIGASMTALGAMLMAFGDVAHGSVGFALAGQVDPATSLAIQKSFFAYPTIGILSGAGMFLPLGLLTLGVGTLRSRLLPRWAGVTLLLSPIAVQVALLADGPAHSLLLLPFVVGMAALARAADLDPLRRTSTQTA
jgi:hypothetical protein